MPQMQAPQMPFTNAPYQAKQNVIEAVQSASETVLRIADAEQRKANDIVNVESQYTLDKWEESNLPTALSTSGKNAIGLPQKVEEQFKKDMASYRDTLGNEAVK